MDTGDIDIGHFGRSRGRVVAYELGLKLYTVCSS